MNDDNTNTSEYDDEYDYDYDYDDYYDDNYDMENSTTEPNSTTIDLSSFNDTNTTSLTDWEYKSPNHSSSFGDPVTIQNMNEFKPNRANFLNMQVNTDELTNTINIGGGVFDIYAPSPSFATAPAIYIIESKQSLKQEKGKDFTIDTDIKRSQNHTNNKFILMAEMYIFNVKKYNQYHQVFGIWRAPDNLVYNFEISIDTAKYKDNLYQAFIDNNIKCFKSLNRKTINHYLNELISKKISQFNTIPKKTGFYQYTNGIWFFISNEYCFFYHYPIVTQKHFSNVLKYLPNKTVNMFLKLRSKQKYPHTFMLLNIIRIAALFTSVINSYKVFCKIIVINGDYSKISPYLQIYDRGFSETKEISINILPDKIDELISEYKDDVILFNDEVNTSDFKRKNGEGTIKILVGIVSKSAPKDHPFIPCVVSERLGAFLDGYTFSGI